MADPGLIAVAVLHLAVAAAPAMPDTVSVGAGAVPSPDTFSLSVKPLPGPTGAVIALEVRERLDGPAGDAPLSLKAALSATGVLHIADGIADLTVEDATGPVSLTSRDDPATTGFNSAFRHWQAVRPVRFPVEVRYRFGVEPAEDRGAPVGMKPAGKGVAGSGIGFLLLPETLDSTVTRMSWDLSALPQGSIGVVSAGEGATDVNGPPAAMTKQWFLAGPATTVRAPPPSGFQAYLIGQPPFDGPGMLEFADRSYATLAAWFRYLGAPPYRVFVRAVNGVSYGTGVAGEGRGSSLINVGDAPWPGQDPIDIYTTTFHELTHQWVGLIDGRASWFEEGLTVYVSTVLPCHTGLLGPSDCVKQFNNAIRSSLTSSGRDWSQARIDAAPFTDESIRSVPYGRGALYFANLDAQLRMRSHGRRALRDVLIPLLAARETGQSFGQAEWETMLRRELGPGAVTEFRETMIEGVRRIVPPSGALGPCWRRVSVPFALKTGDTVPGFAWTPVARRAETCTAARFRSVRTQTPPLSRARQRRPSAPTWSPG